MDFGLAHSQEFGDVDKNWSPTPLPHQKRQFSFATSNPRKPMLTRALVDDEYHLLRKFWDATGSGDKLVLRNSSKSNVTTSSSNADSPKTACVCGNRLTVCRGCLGFSKGAVARRGGTVGYRPPEVIYNIQKQTTAVDMWAVGVIFCSFLTGHYPFIVGDNDFVALQTFAHLLSLERMQNGAKAIGRDFFITPKPPPLEGQKEYIYLKIRCVYPRILPIKLC